MILLLIILISLVLSIIWVLLIDYMQRKYPNYEGEDMFNEKDDLL